MLADKDLVSIQEVRDKVAKAYAAWQKYRHQEQVDNIVEMMATAARAEAQRLAEMAVERPATATLRTSRWESVGADLPRMRG
jgi:acyl-CoA reductase-like NAD-dependent aldehyde dehydrogenase